MRKHHLFRSLPAALLSSALLLTAPQLSASAAVISVGDVNSDGVVSVADGVALSRFIAKWDDIVINTDAADLNRDGTIKLEDATILTRYIAGWDGYEQYIVNIDTEHLSTLQITKQPQDAAIEYGKEALLSVEVKGGLAPYTYQWKQNGVPIEGADKAEFNVSDAGLYSCAVTDHNGTTVYSDLAAVKFALTITWPPMLNDKNELAIVAAGGTEPYTYQWQIKSGDAWDNVENGTSDVIIISKNGIYRCVVTDAEGTKKISSEFPVTKFLTVTKQPQDNAEILSVAAEGGTEPYTYQWEVQMSETYWADVEGGNQPDLKPADNGVFRCVITDDAGQKAISDSAQISYFTKYTVFLEDHCDNIVPIAEVIMEALGIKYGPARTLVEQAPVVIAEHMWEKDAKALTEKIIEAGGKAKYYEDPPPQVYTVSITHYDPTKKDTLINALAEALDITIEEAQKIIDNVPCVVLTTEIRERAEKLIEVLEQNGAYVSSTGLIPDEPEKSQTYTVTLEKYGTAEAVTLIKILKETLNIPLKEAKDLVEKAPCVVLTTEDRELALQLIAALEEAGAVVSSTGFIPESEQKLTVLLTDFDEDKRVPTIKVIQSVTGLGLMDAKAVLESPLPAVLLDNTDDEKALAAKSELEAVGASVAFSDTRDVFKDPALSSGNVSVLMKSCDAEKFNQVVPILRKELCVTLNEAIYIAERVISGNTSFMLTFKATPEKAKDLETKLTAAGAVLEISGEGWPPEAHDRTLYLHSYKEDTFYELIALIVEELNIDNAQATKLVSNLPALLSDTLTADEQVDLRTKLENLGALVTYQEVPALTDFIEFKLVVRNVIDRDGTIFVIRKFFGINVREAAELLDSGEPLVSSPRPYAEAFALQENLTGYADCEIVLRELPPMKVVLESFDSEKRQYIAKVVSRYLEISVEDALEMIDSAPVILAERMDPDKAQALKAALEQYGAVVTITEVEQEG